LAKKISVATVEVVTDGATIAFAKVINFPTIITGTAARRVTITGVNFQGVEMTSTSIRAISRA